MSSTRTLPVKIFTWKKEKSCSPGARDASILRLGSKGLPVENELLAITSTQMMALNQNLAHIKNSSPVTLKITNIVFISQVIYHVTILLKIVIITQLLTGLIKEIQK